MWAERRWCKCAWRWPGSRKRSRSTKQPEPVETQAGDVSQVVTQQAIQGLPLNGRRFTDLALLTPGVTQDPRGLTSNSNGDLSFGGTRGFQNSFLVDGADNNNSFFAQARGRYRAPYQFSNEVIKEFRVSSNAYSAELGKAGGAVFNVVTKSGTNNWHGSGFYYLRDRIFDASTGLRHQRARRSPAAIRRHHRRTDPQRPGVFLRRLRPASADHAFDHAVCQWRQLGGRNARRLRLHRPATGHRGGSSN